LARFAAAILPSGSRDVETGKHATKQQQQEQTTDNNNSKNNSNNSNKRQTARRQNQQQLMRLQEAVTILAQHYQLSRPEAVKLGQRLVDSSYVYHVVKEHDFKDKK
jgi:hypothetical protein